MRGQARAISAPRRKPFAILGFTTFHRFGEMGASSALFCEVSAMVDVHVRERELEREVARTVEPAVPGIEVLTVELAGPERFTVFVDHAAGVDHALCERVTNLLRGYLDRYTVDVSSPGIERPLRTAAHFARVVGRRVSLRTAGEIAGRKRFRGEVVAAGERAVTVGADGSTFDIPYDAIVRGNLIEER
jgi:ribosome maturation factor RimP